MTDYFALLGQPRQPWLDPDELKEIFHAGTLRAHPDVQPQNGDGAFAELNEAYQVLRDPKRRLHHLLALLDLPAASGSGAIPPALEELFPMIAGLTHDAEALLQKCGGAASALSRSLLQPQVLAMKNRMETALQKLRALEGNATTRLRQVRATESDELQALYLEFSYLTKWIAELEEKQLRLATAL